MKPIEISTSQIGELYQFTRKHFVEHYDVQTELVDHLANDIEHIWSENPNISFDTAKMMAFKKFGVFGFMEIVEEKTKAMTRTYWKIMWRFAKEWFQLPKLIITMASIYFFYILLKFEYGTMMCVSIEIVLLVFLIVKQIKYKKIIKAKQKKSKKRWMLEDLIIGVGDSNGVISLMNFFNIINLQNLSTESSVMQFVLAVFFTTSILFLYISLMVLPPKAQQLLEEQYPEYKLV